MTKSILNTTGLRLTNKAVSTDIANFSPLCPTIQSRPLNYLRFRSFNYFFMQLFWGIIQDRVYKTNVKDAEELRQRIVYDLDQHTIIDTAIRQWCKILQACVAAKGGQFEHAL